MISPYINAENNFIPSSVTQHISTEGTMQAWIKKRKKEKKRKEKKRKGKEKKDGRLKVTNKSGLWRM